MPVHELAGKPAPRDLLIDVADLENAYYRIKPDVSDPAAAVSFGTSGHRGCSLDGSFNEDHILAISQAICEYRSQAGITGPVYLGKDTHALSAVAQKTAVEVLAANNVNIIIHRDDEVTPTPVISHAILTHNRAHERKADGIIITPSHNPPRDGGFKYNPPDGGPAGSDITSLVQNRANELLKEGNAGVRRIPCEQALQSEFVSQQDLIRPYVRDLPSVIDIEAIKSAGVRIGVDPLGGASLRYWQAIAEQFSLDITIVNPRTDPAFSFMTVDHDGKIRMDCSSPYAMAGLVKLKDQYDIACGNDPDSDRHGIVTPSVGLMNPNHFLAVSINYLFSHREQWGDNTAIGKTLVSSSMIDRVADDLGRKLVEVPVGFKWFAPGLYDGSLGFGGEESAGASFLRRDGSVWSTDKDGIIMCLLAAEILALTGKDPGQHYAELTRRFGTPVYRRIDAPATREEKALLKSLQPDDVSASTLAGEPIIARLTCAPGNDAPIGGLKVVTENGWFAARPSGTEMIYKIYAESFRGTDHLETILQEAQQIVGNALASGVN